MRRRENHSLRRRLSASAQSARVFAVHREELDLDRFVAALLAAEPPSRSGAYTLDTLLAALAGRGLRTRPTPKYAAKPLSRSQLATMLIDGPTFAKAKAVLAAHNSSAEKDRKHHHYLKGSLYCGRCGARMSLTWAKATAAAIPTSSASAAAGAPAASSPTSQST